ncbi:hypothetical protein G7Y89_g15534 [Cudoniella acicularis]|uniref:Uncharacterized protein n=1 Tax=Cudoniella acicularis TaxID=354080 RepID=A0A8H4VM29_9HELO|nr:hypothetical protein G7Y89_g15534 [Cudoniella acicularis]
MARRSKRVAKCSGFSGTNPTLALPIELRQKILKSLLLTSAPLFFYHRSNRLNRRKQKILYVNDQALIGQYDNLSSVSKALRSEVQATFFGMNEWKFDIGLTWTRGCRGTKTTRNDVEEMAERWGDAACSRLRRVHLKIVAEIGTERALSPLLQQVATSFKGARLKRITVEWLPEHNVTFDSCGPKELARTISMMKRGNRAIRLPISSRYLKRWLLTETAMEPLTRLRPVEEVLITGGISEEWVAWLVNALKSTKAPSEFVREPLFQYAPVQGTLPEQYKKAEPIHLDAICPDEDYGGDNEDIEEEYSDE